MDNAASEPTQPSTPIRGHSAGVTVGSSAYASQSHAYNLTTRVFTAQNMGPHIKVDLQGAKECKVAEMIKFLFSFCKSDDKNFVADCNERHLNRAFRAAKEVAKNDSLKTKLSNFLNARSEAAMYDPFITKSDNKYGIRGSPRLETQAGPEDCPVWRSVEDTHSTGVEQPESEASGTIQKKEGSEQDAAGGLWPPVLQPDDPVNIQNGIYAAERLCCAPEITHSINFILRGSTLYITWSDRQGVIRTAGFDIIHNLPHFLLVLLILQRFDLGRWGLFTAFKESPITQSGAVRKRIYLEYTLNKDDPICIYPYQDPLHPPPINLVGRPTIVAGARKAASSQEPESDQEIRDANKLVAKFYWPEQTRVSEVKILEEAARIGDDNELVKNRIPTVVSHLDPPYITCSTRFIREFLGIETDGARVLRTVSSVTGHSGRRESSTGSISIDNLMYHPVTKRGVLNDFDLARSSTQVGSSRAKDNTGTRPFMALDLLSEEASKGQVKRLYRHDAESFAWCLVYICICMTKNERGEISTITPNPLFPWFDTATVCQASKQKANKMLELLAKTTIHASSTHFAAELCDLWITRFHDQESAMNVIVQDSSGSRLARFSLIPRKSRVYEEPSDREWFRQVCQVMFRALDTSNPAPISMPNPIFDQMVDHVLDKYQFVESVQPVE
ncbi:hypothetical protein BJ322DRAFT_1214318 [Thelephora terrestris]|uniref:Fungal-type protein kinase domain-containing protein n=1 Tax=Thelephora terrestris TaxID=56493 RepID=A0A9P6H4R6_9AGAM|nr:hypothetical protein BJ322DRAFT_1214318 [Thelephora terrestris]